MPFQKFRHMMLLRTWCLNMALQLRLVHSEDKRCENSVWTGDRSISPPPGMTGFSRYVSVKKYDIFENAGTWLVLRFSRVCSLFSPLLTDPLGTKLPLNWCSSNCYYYGIHEFFGVLRVNSRSFKYTLQPLNFGVTKMRFEKSTNGRVFLCI